MIKTKQPVCVVEREGYDKKGEAKGSPYRVGKHVMDEDLIKWGINWGWLEKVADGEGRPIVRVTGRGRTFLARIT